MMKFEDLEPELQEAVNLYRHYGQEVFAYDRKVYKSNLEADLKKLHEATEKRNHWQNRVKELIKGREKELNWLLIG
jgi:LPS O-antigen subunit length determinant protein (WzzB/FepE family)